MYTRIRINLATHSHKMCVKYTCDEKQGKIWSIVCGFIDPYIVYGIRLVINGPHKNCNRHKSDLRVWNDKD